MEGYELQEFTKSVREVHVSSVRVNGTSESDVLEGQQTVTLE